MPHLAEIERILDDRLVLQTTGYTVRKWLVKWKGYDTDTWYTMYKFNIHNIINSTNTKGTTGTYMSHRLF